MLNWPLILIDTCMNEQSNASDIHLQYEDGNDRERNALHWLCLAHSHSFVNEWRICVMCNNEINNWMEKVLYLHEILFVFSSLWR